MTNMKNHQKTLKKNGKKNHSANQTEGEKSVKKKMELRAFWFEWYCLLIDANSVIVHGLLISGKLESGPKTPLSTDVS